MKLTPAVVAVANFVSGRRRPAWVAFGTFVLASAIGLVLWSDSIHYWVGLLHGDSAPTVD